MKKFVRIGLLCAAVTALAVGAVAPAGAGGYPEHGTVIATPDPVEPGGVVTVSNADDEDSTCQHGEGPSYVVAYVYTLDNEFFDVQFFGDPDENGNWSFNVQIPDDPASIGTWEIDAFCTWDGADVQPVAFPQFLYELTNFEVVGADEPIVPEDDVAPAEEVVTTPRFTG